MQCSHNASSCIFLNRECLPSHELHFYMKKIEKYEQIMHFGDGDMVTRNVKRDNLIFCETMQIKDTASAALVWKGLKVLMYSWGMVSPLPSSALTTVVCTCSEECGPSGMWWWILTEVPRCRNCSTEASRTLQSLLRPVLARVPEVEAAGEHEAALGTALVLHRHQLADVRLEILIIILFLTIPKQYLFPHLV